MSEIPRKMEKDEYEDILTEYIGGAQEITVAATNNKYYIHEANFDFILNAIWVYGSSADRKRIWINNNEIWVCAHPANSTQKFDPKDYLIPSGAKIEIESIAAAAGTHGVSIFGKKLTKVRDYV